jgi:hypothetical protein
VVCNRQGLGLGQADVPRYACTATTCACFTCKQPRAARVRGREEGPRDGGVAECPMSHQ